TLLHFVTYYPDPCRSDPRWHPAERDALATVLSISSHSLRKLILPIESAPLGTISDTCWPQLREVRLNGEQPSTLHNTVPYATVLCGMPELRSLRLTLVLRPDVSVPIVWPRGLDLE
ncbi:hypothetical protein TRAPUB_14001, partial [Trametes pubescens]